MHFSKAKLGRLVIFLVVFLVCLGIIIGLSQTPSALLMTSYDDIRLNSYNVLVDLGIDPETFKKDQKELLRLLELCHNGDKDKNPYLLTKSFQVSAVNMTRDLYINTCYPLEISTSQGGRSMGHCSDFVLFVYYAGARLAPEYGAEVYEEHVKNCPHSTYLHGEYPIYSLYNASVRNVWMPNIEQVKYEQEFLIPKTSLFLAKTRKTYDILQTYMVNQTLDIPIQYSAHSTPDPLYQVPKQNIRKNLNQFYHGNGHSGLKGTNVLKDCWKGHPDWPVLYLVGDQNETDTANMKYFRILELEKLRTLQMQSGVHICTSIREGFGHYINEGTAMGALVLTTDFGPMNEFVTSKSGMLVPIEDHYREAYQLFDGVQVKVHPRDICAGIKKILHLSLEERMEYGKNARRYYLERYVDMINSKQRFGRNAIEHFYGSKRDEDVIFAELDEEMREYIRNYRPQDKQ